VKTVTVVLVAMLFGFPNTGLSTEMKAVPPYRAESSAYIVQGKDAWTYVTENRSFRFAEVLGDKGNYESQSSVILLCDTQAKTHSYAWTHNLETYPGGPT
jgi:hypothetical protein